MAQKPSLEELLKRKATLDIIRMIGRCERIQFDDITDQLNVSGPTISTRLDNLQYLGIVDRKFIDDMPPVVWYSLTYDGRRLYSIVRMLFEWAENYDPDSGSGREPEGLRTVSEYDFTSIVDPGSPHTPDIGRSWPAESGEPIIGTETTD